MTTNRDTREALNFKHEYINNNNNNNIVTYSRMGTFSNGN